MELAGAVEEQDLPRPRLKRLLRQGWFSLLRNVTALPGWRHPRAAWKQESKRNLLSKSTVTPSRAQLCRMPHFQAVPYRIKAKGPPWTPDCSTAGCPMPASLCCAVPCCKLSQGRVVSLNLSGFDQPFRPRAERLPPMTVSSKRLRFDTNPRV